MAVVPFSSGTPVFVGLFIRQTLHLMVPLLAVRSFDAFSNRRLDRNHWKD